MLCGYVVTYRGEEEILERAVNLQRELAITQIYERMEASALCDMGTSRGLTAMKQAAEYSSLCSFVQSTLPCT